MDQKDQNQTQQTSSNNNSNEQNYFKLHDYTQIGFVGEGKLLCRSYGDFIIAFNYEHQVVHFISESNVSEPYIFIIDTFQLK